MEIRTGLEGKPWYMAALLGAALAAIVYWGGHTWLIKPKKQRIERLETRLVELQSRIQEGRAAKQQLPRFREEVRRLEAELDQLLQILPARRNTPELLRRIRALTEQGNFNLQKFTPGGYLERDFYSEWPITINLEGSYHNLALLFDRVSRFSRVINIEDLRIEALRRGNPLHTISASFKAKTFVYKEPTPEEEAGAP